MAFERPGMMLYYSDWNALKGLDMAQRGALISALMDFAQTGEVPTFDDQLTAFAFSMLSEKTLRDAERYREKCITNAYNRYRGVCKQNGTRPIPKQEWLTTVNDRWEKETEPERETEPEMETEFEPERDHGETNFEAKRREALAKAVAAWK